MVTWSEFEKMNDIEWKAKADDDLKGKKSSDDLLFYVDNDIQISPFLTNAPKPEPITGIWTKSGVLVKGNSWREINSKAIKMLKLGAQSLVIEIDESVDFKVLFDDIYLEIIDVYLKVDNLNIEKTSKKLKEYLGYHYNEKNTNVFICRFIFQLENEATFSERMKSFSQYCSSISDASAINNYVFLSLKKDFLSQIAELRAIRQYWQMAGKNPKHLTIISYIEDSMLRNTEIHPLIIANYLLMSAYFGMSDVVLGVSFGDDEEMARLNLNIQHIFKEESYLNFVSDPTAGSYLIERITNELLNTVD